MLSYCSHDVKYVNKLEVLSTKTMTLTVHLVAL